MIEEDTDMDPNVSSGPSPGAGKKSLQEMSKEELVQKCKALLNLAQKAKSAKDGKNQSLLFCLLFFSLHFACF